MERFAAMVKRSIDAGIPVLAYEEKWNMALLSGYENGGEKVVMRDYYVPTRTIPMSQVGPLLIFVENPTEALPAKEAYAAGLEHAVESWSQKYDPQGKSVLGRPYRYGAEALQQWHGDIAAYDQWTDKERETLFFVSWWCFTSLDDARNAAIEFIPRALAGDAAEGASAASRGSGVLQGRTHGAG